MEVIRFSDRVSLRVGDEVQVQGATEEVAERMRELVRQTCEAFEIRIVRGGAPEEEVLGQALLGERVLLSDGGADDAGDDQAVLGASLRA